MRGKLSAIGRANPPQAQSEPDREWLIPPEVWKSEICNGLDSTMVARTLAERGMLLRASDGFQPVRKIGGANKRVYSVTASIFAGGNDKG